jgi:hypothetical protein
VEARDEADHGSNARVFGGPRPEDHAEAVEQRLRGLASEAALHLAGSSDPIPS